MRHPPSWPLAAVATVLAACLAAPIAAQPKAAIDCDNAASTPEIAFCAAEDLKKADLELNAVYRAVLAEISRQTHLNTNQRRDWERAVREAQRHWLAFREKDCGEVIGWEWFQGTGMGGASLACKAQKTWARAAELKSRNEPK